MRRGVQLSRVRCGGQRLQNSAACSRRLQHDLGGLGGAGRHLLCLDPNTLHDPLDGFLNYFDPHGDSAVFCCSSLLIGCSPALLGTPDGGTSGLRRPRAVRYLRAASRA